MLLAELRFKFLIWIQITNTFNSFTLSSTQIVILTPSTPRKPEIQNFDRKPTKLQLGECIHIFDM